MTTLAQSVRIAYRSSAIACSAHRTKELIARKKREEADKQVRNMKNGPERQEANRRLSLWSNYFTAQGFAVKFFRFPTGIKSRLEGLWVQMGRDIADLPDWNGLASRDLKTVVAFKDLVGLELSEIRRVERNFVGNSAEIPTNTFEEQFEELMDLFVNDIWAAEGMRRWTRDELVRGPEKPKDLKEWDFISGTAGEFFENAMHCCKKIATNFRQYERGDDGGDTYKNKYIYQTGNHYNAVEGLWSIDAGDLKPAYRKKVENKRVTYR